MGLKPQEPTPQMQAFRNDLIALLDKHAGQLDASEILAVAAYSVGQIMAMQDARKWTPAACMELVASNMQQGNSHAVAEAHKWMPRA